ncbi:MAG: hypothetical protein PHQ78_03245 [Candidatus Cloacimonetes bacterium]|jgi:hypothetical protein|nr:hypothetical protein [Candidatus Cloacimonadota bacterium]MDD2506314.1 hypothetical protein [Candidatus Cloacimonadota bacterium]MDD4559866.1 hypothetical protein [Candidatus Cloacimonadota bacterium]
MKTRLVFILMLVCTGLFAQSADTLSVMNVSMYANPFYESYSRNFHGAEAAGRGYTGAAVLGGAEAGLINPAVMMADSAYAFAEISVKPSQDVDGLIFNANYVSPMPLGIFGFGFPVGSRMVLSAMYSNPKSIQLQDFIIEINQGADLVVRSPKYNLHQFSALANYRVIDSIRLGLAAHYQLHNYFDPIFLHSYDRVEESVAALRLQPGILMEHGPFMAGLSATLPTPIEVDLRYGNYDYDLPLELSGGLSYTKGEYRLSGDCGFINDSALDGRFNDRFSLHLGGERHRENRIFRAGYMYRSDVWEGEIMLPLNTTANADTSMFWEDVPTSMRVKNDSQHFITAGISYLFKHGKIDASIMHCIIGDNPQTQFNIGLGIKLNTFFSKELPERR